MAEKKDLTGQVFGHLTVIKEDFDKPKGSRRRWLCQCDCGREDLVSIAQTNLLSGNSKSCGCQRGKNLKENFKDLTNKKIGALFVLEKTRTENGKLGWICKCDCGKIVTITADALNSGNTTSCGCHIHRGRISRVDLTNQRFGKLVALKVDEEKTSKSDKVYWICKCDCGALTSVQFCNLISKNTMSCGCIRSKGELLICQALTNLNIIFEREKTFPSLVGKNNGYLKFDFYLPEYNILIEYQGEQHYKKSDFFGGEQKFKEQCEYDQLKKDYCQKYNIKLLCISFKDFNKINDTYIQKLIKGD